MTMTVDDGVGVGLGLGDVRMIVDDGVGVGDVATAGLMTSAIVAEADVPALAVTVTLKLPAAVGVPLIVPAELIASPPGSPLAAHVMVPAPPVAATVAL
jgi:hypothetical protein